MTSTRPPAVAGTFYPADAAELRRVVTGLLAEAAATGAGPPPRAIVGPHAGYVYSGAVAASAYAALASSPAFRRVVLLGPAHRLAFEGLALPSHAAFRTPLGDVPVDATARQALADLPQVRVLDAAHAREHGLEVHLPFLQVALGPAAIVPLVVGEAGAAAVGAVIERLWDGPQTLVVVSSDLSHYHDYATACRLDAATSRAIEALRYDDLDEGSACGRAPLRGLLWVAARRGLTARTLDLRNSGDTAGPRDRVVGYGAYAFA
jgi:AmmeMemoRadiSam system protein B